MYRLAFYSGLKWLPGPVFSADIALEVRAAAAQLALACRCRCVRVETLDEERQVVALAWWTQAEGWTYGHAHPGVPA